MGEVGKNQDIHQRSYDFSCEIIKLARNIKTDHISRSMITQLVRSGTSISANLREADAAETKKDFIHKVAISLKEARETSYWLQIIKDSSYATGDDIVSLINESLELSKILAKIKINAQASITAK